MRKKPHLLRDGEPRTFEDSRTIDVNDRRCLRFWSERLGVSEAEIAEVVREVGPNTTAVALKLEAPAELRTAPPTLPQR
jgi:hypothetical protein